MKNLLILFSVLFLTGCSSDDETISDTAIEGVWEKTTIVDSNEFDELDENLNYESVIQYKFLKASKFESYTFIRATESSDIAEEALSLIDVTYEVLSPVLTAPEAMKEDASLLHDDLFTDEIGYKSDKPSNIAEHSQFMVGDVRDKERLKSAFRDVDIISNLLII